MNVGRSQRRRGPLILEGMSEKDLEQLYRNCVAASVDGKGGKERAEALIEEINGVWQARSSAAMAGT